MTLQEAPSTATSIFVQAALSNPSTKARTKRQGLSAGITSFRVDGVTNAFRYGSQRNEFVDCGADVMLGNGL